MVTSLTASTMLVVGCATPAASPDADPEPAGSASASVSTTPAPETSLTPVPTPTPTPIPLSPLTGNAQDTPQPVLVVKLDNTRNAMPHAGLKAADLVYIEEVEYGITRIAAVFNSKIPNRIGPVRSARITDLDLLSQYGSPGFAFSGAQRKLWPAITNSTLVDLSANKAAADYTRDTSRRAPYNYFFNGKSAIKNRDDISFDTNIGFTFSEDSPLGGQVNKSARLEWSYASAAFTFDPEQGKYAVDLNGERASAEEGDGLQWADTVVIQLVKQTPSEYFDRGGGNTPHAKTIGTGKALILRDGMSYQAQWSRQSEDSGTLFTNDLGIPISFKPGQTWIVLYDKSRDPKLKPLKQPGTPTVSTQESNQATPSPS